MKRPRTISIKIWNEGVRERDTERESPKYNGSDPKRSKMQQRVSPLSDIYENCKQTLGRNNPVEFWSLAHLIRLWNYSPAGGRGVLGRGG